MSPDQFFCLGPGVESFESLIYFFDHVAHTAEQKLDIPAGRAELSVHTALSRCLR